MFQQRNRGPLSYPNNIHLRNQAFYHSYKPYFNLRQNSNELGFCHFIPNSTSSTFSINSFPPGFPKHINETAGHEDFECYKGEIRTVYLSNVSSRCTKGDIFKACSVFGKVESISLHINRYRQDCQFGFVRYERHEQAARAIDRLQGTRRFWMPWRVEWAYKNSLDNSEREAAINNINNVERQTRRRVVGVESEKMSKCLVNSWVLVSGVPISVAKVQEALQKKGTKFERVVKWGTFGVLVTGTSSEEDHTWQDHEVWLPNYFVKVFKFQHDSTFLKKYVWVECIGIPVQAWDVVNMEKIVEAWGSLLALDLDTACFLKADVARIFMETSCINNIDGLIDFEFKEKIFKVKVKETSLVDVRTDAKFLVSTGEVIHSQRDAKTDQGIENILSLKPIGRLNIDVEVSGAPEHSFTDMGATVVLESPQTPAMKPGVEKVCKRCDKDMDRLEDGEFCKGCETYRKKKEERNFGLDDITNSKEAVAVVATQVTPEQLLSVKPQNQHIRFLDMSGGQITPSTGKTKGSESQSEDMDSICSGSNIGLTAQTLNFDSQTCQHSKMGAEKGSTKCDCVQRHKKRKELFLQDQERNKRELEMKMKDVADTITQKDNAPKSPKKSRGRPKGSKNKKKKKGQKEMTETSKRGASTNRQGFKLHDEDDSDIDTNLDEDLQDGLELFEGMGINMSNGMIEEYADFIGAKVPN